MSLKSIWAESPNSTSIFFVLVNPEKKQGPRQGAQNLGILGAYIQYHIEIFVLYISTYVTFL